MAAQTTRSMWLWYWTKCMSELVWWHKQLHARSWEKCWRFHQARYCQVNACLHGMRPLEFPYAQFATKDLTGKLIFDPFWSVIYHLERIGLKVISATADGVSPNRSFFRMNSPATSASTSISQSTLSSHFTSLLSSFEYKCKNPKKDTYFFPDPPRVSHPQNATCG